MITGNKATPEGAKNTRVVIVGRPNVGKSTLFNRLVGYRRALVHDLPGVTRDRLEVDATWWVKARAFPVRVTDTGGLGGEKFADEIKKQVGIALEDADVVLMVFDGQVGLTSADEILVREFVQAGLMKRLPVFGIVNKVDATLHEDRINEFYAVGLDHLVTVSAEHDRGIDDLQMAIAEALEFDFENAPVADTSTKVSMKAAHVEALLSKSSAKSSAGEDESEEDDLDGAWVAESDAGEEDEISEETPEEFDEESLEDELKLDDELEDEEESPALERRVPRVAILGRPNVGKSTLVNALLRQDRMITSPIAGTTVDSIDSVVELEGKAFVVIDTAGIRRKSKTEQGVEVLSVVQSRKALESADIALLVLDGESGLTDQDEKIGGLIEESGKSVILAINKWDTQKINPEFTREMAADVLRKEMGFLKYAPIVFMSALHGKGIDGLGELIDDILEQRRVKIPTHELTKWMRKEATIHNPENAKFFLAHQSGRHPPTFVVHVNDPERVHFSLRRHLVNALRERWGYMGSPLKMLFVEGKSRKSSPKTPGWKKKAAHVAHKASSDAVAAEKASIR